MAKKKTKRAALKQAAKSKSGKKLKKALSRAIAETDKALARVKAKLKKKPAKKPAKKRSKRALRPFRSDFCEGDESTVKTAASVPVPGMVVSDRPPAGLGPLDPGYSPPAALTDEQLSEVAACLSGKRLNVYFLVKNRFGIEVGEEIFQQLKEQHRLFKCENCDVWLDLSEKDPDMGPESEFCTQCVNNMNRRDDEEEIED